MPLYIYLHFVGISNCITDKNESREEKRVQRVSELAAVEDQELHAMQIDDEVTL